MRFSPTQALVTVSMGIVCKNSSSNSSFSSHSILTSSVLAWSSSLSPTWRVKSANFASLLSLLAISATFDTSFRVITVHRWASVANIASNRLSSQSVLVCHCHIWCALIATVGSSGWRDVRFSYRRGVICIYELS